MVLIKWLFAAGALSASLAAAFVLVRFNLRRRKIIHAAFKASEDQLQHIYELVEACGTEPPNGVILARTNRTVSDLSCIVPMPTSIPDFPWSDQTVVVTSKQKIEFKIIGGQARETRLLGKIYRYVRVPRRRTKSGKCRNIYIPRQYIAAHPRLSAVLSEVCPQYPQDLLAYLLCAGSASFEFEPINQARIGTSASWVQDPEFQICGLCHKRMALILQLPGTMLHASAYHRGTFFLFGCKRHPDQIKTVEQYT